MTGTMVVFNLDCPINFPSEVRTTVISILEAEIQA